MRSACAKEISIPVASRRPFSMIKVFLEVWQL